MRPRVSILNLLFVTTIVALLIVVLRVHGELAKERALRIRLLQKGGILQVTDPNAVHVVQVSTSREPGTRRWRIYVPEGRTATVDARVEPVPADKPIAPRLPPNAIVVAERSPANAVQLGPGESVVSVECGFNGTPYLTLDIVGEGGRKEGAVRAEEGTLDWYRTRYFDDLTQVEHAAKTFQNLRDGRTVQLEDGKTFVLGRFREPRWGAVRSGRPSAKKIGEVLIWIHPDDG